MIYSKRIRENHNLSLKGFSEIFSKILPIIYRVELIAMNFVQENTLDHLKDTPSPPTLCLNINFPRSFNKTKEKQKQKFMYNFPQNTINNKPN